MSNHLVIDALRTVFWAQAETLIDVANDADLVEVGRRAIEDTLIDFRDSRLSQPMRGNGLVCREQDGTESSIIRLGPEDAIRIGLRAIAEHLQKELTVARYKDETLNWVTFNNDKEKAVVEIPCEVVLIPEKMLTISYQEAALPAPSIWKGEGRNGSYILRLASHPKNASGDATMHFLSEHPRLEGFWSEGNYEGCWWINLEGTPEGEGEDF